MTNPNKIVEQYLAKKQLRWSESTMRTETSRLRILVSKFGAFVQNGEQLLTALTTAKQKPYTIKMAFARLSDVERELGLKRQEYTEFMRHNPRLFARAYQPEDLRHLTYAEIKSRIAEIKDTPARALAEEILYSGMRSKEALTRAAGSDTVIGKGGIHRRVFLSDAADATTIKTERCSYMRLYRALKGVGLKPHTLRKFAATEFVRMGFAPQELLRIMGWTSMQTATVYLQSKRDDEIANKIKEARGV